ncbi:MAG: preprotein translocase subunit SecG [Marivirga sp.]|jgi:preprotein translocase subunit SecG
MLTLIITLIILVAILLVLVVLAQNSKGGGLSSQFGGSGASQIVGVKRTGDILEKTTWFLAITLVILCLTSSIVIKTSKIDTGFSSPNLEKVQNETILPGFDNNEEGLLPTEETLEDAAPLNELKGLENDSSNN